MYSLFRWLSSRYGTTIYIQVWESRLKVTNARNGLIFDQRPLVATVTTRNERRKILSVGDEAAVTGAANVVVVNPFSHPRSLVSDFLVAEKLLQSAIKSVVSGKGFSLAPRLVIHPMEKLDGGLTAIEVRAFMELGLGSGARKTVVFEGAELTPGEIDFDEIKERVENEVSQDLV